MWCALPAAMVSLAFLDDGRGTPAGFGLAIASGAVATRLGYIVWYPAVLHLTVGRGQRSAVAAGGHGAGRRGIAG